MSRRRSKHAAFEEPSLVPLADMLTNTVGIMVFILMFTVLTASAVAIHKRLPMEHESKATDTRVIICKSNRAYPLRYETVRIMIESAREKLKDLSKPTSRKDIHDRAKLIGRIDQEDEDIAFSLVASAEEDSDSCWLEYTVTCRPKPGRGTAPPEFRKSPNALDTVLEGQAASDTAVIFWVKPDSVAAFAAARDLALSRGFSCSWIAENENDEITFPINPNGRSGPIRVQ